MKATASAHGAVTVVNAIPAGRGAAFGIELATEATVDLDPRPGGVEVTIQGSAHEDASLARACLAVVAEHLEQPLSGTVTTTSEIPIARGLKSSSTAANAVILAALEACQAPRDPDTVLQLSVQAARRAQVTLTGALDDAAASLLGGLVFTDNREDVVLERKPIQTDHVVLLLVPPTQRYTQTTGGSLDQMAPLADACFSKARAGRWERALTVNGLAVAACLGEPLDPAYRALAAGAQAAGMTGTGPAVAALCHRDEAASIRQAWERYQGEVLATHPTNQGVAS